MTGKEFEAAGLDQLSPSELESLNEWIRRHSLATLATPKTGPATAYTEEDDRRGLKSESKEDRTEIVSTLIGRFSGWDGQTTFKLENGMVWLQADKGKFYIKEVKDPTVIIEPGMFGTWKLRIEGHDENCKVKRIQ